MLKCIPSANLIAVLHDKMTMEHTLKLRHFGVNVFTADMHQRIMLAKLK
jgi:hypothetical protein